MAESGTNGEGKKVTEYLDKMKILSDTSQEFLAEVMDEIEKKVTKVDIEEDPIELGANYIHEMLKNCRSNIDVLEELILHMTKKKNVLEQGRKNLEQLKNMRFNQLITNGVKDTKGWTRADREDFVQTNLRSEISVLNRLSTIACEADELLRFLKLKLDGQYRLNSDIRLQWSVMQSEMEFLNREGPHRSVTRKAKEVPKETKKIENVPSSNEVLDQIDLEDLVRQAGGLDEKGS